MSARPWEIWLTCNGKTSRYSSSYSTREKAEKAVAVARRLWPNATFEVRERQENTR